MKFLRVLTNSILNGLFFSILIALLTLDININLPFRARAFGELALALALPYGLMIVVLSVILFFVIQFFASRRFAVKIISPSFLSLSIALIIAFYLLIFWKNQAYFRSFFDARIRGLLQIQVWILAALSALAAGAFYVSRRFKKSILPFTTYFLIFVIGVLLTIGQRARYPSPGEKTSKTGSLEARKLDKNIILIGLEGLSFDFIIPLIQEGKLPNFSWLVDNGSWGRIETLSPTESFTLNRSLMTGKFPSKHRQLSPVSYKFSFGEYPLEVTPRYILFRQMTRFGLLTAGPNDRASVAEDIGGIIEANEATALNLDRPSKPDKSRPDPKAEKAFSALFKYGPLMSHRLLDIAQTAFYSDWDNEEAAFVEKSRRQPVFFHLLLDGLNTVEAYFFKYSFPEMFGSIAQEDLNHYGLLIARYYEYYDQMLGKYLAALKDDEILVIYSPYGIEPLPLWKRFAEWILGNSDVSAYHEDHPDGAVLIYGKGIARRNTIEEMNLVDIVPTLLYYLGLPVGRDMDGIVRSPVFIQEFTAENPILSISSYEEIEIKKGS